MLVWAFVVLFLTILVESSYGLKISGSTSSIISYSLEPCPTGWESLDGNAQYKGRVIKGTVSVGEGGVLSAEAAHSSSTQIPTHKHPISDFVSVQFYDDDFGYKVRCDTPVSPTAASAQIEFEVGNFQSSHLPYYPAVNLNLCRLSSGDLYVPPGIIFFVAPGKGSCPTGSSSFSTGNGRLFVFASQGRSLVSSVVSPCLQWHQMSP